MNLIKQLSRTMVFSFFLSLLLVSPTSAATQAELQAQLDVLLSQVEDQSDEGIYEKGDYIITTSSARVYFASSVSSKVVGTQPKGSTGILQSGPVKKGGYIWYRVDFENGLDGWVMSKFIKLAESNEVISVYDNDVRNTDLDIDGKVANITFTVGFKVAVLPASEEIYIADDLHTNKTSPGIIYRIDGPKTNLVKASIMSTAENNNGYFEVHEGYNEEFTLTIEVTASESGEYRLVVENINYSFDKIANEANIVSYEVTDSGIATEYQKVTFSPAPVCYSFIATPSSIKLGQSSTLTWSTANASIVSISPTVSQSGNLPAKGSLKVYPKTNTEYILNAVSTSNGFPEVAICKTKVYVGTQVKSQSSNQVLGISTDVYTQMSSVLSSIDSLLSELEKSLRR